MHNNGFMANPSKFGAKGGSAKTTKLKGFAYIRKHQPEKYQEMLNKRKTRGKKADL